MRTIALGSSDGLRRGMQVVNTMAPIMVPVGTKTLGRIMDVLGRPIEPRWEDTETDPSVAVRKAQKLIERDKIDFMIGALSSGVAAPLSELAQRYGIIYFNSNSSADTVTNDKCQRVNFVWDANG